jgi:hypothetical protein
MSVVGLVVTAVGLAAMLVVERTGRRGGLFVAKPSASVGFLLVALGSRALESVYGAWVFTGLVLRP